MACCCLHRTEHVSSFTGSVESSLRSPSAESVDTGITLPISRWTTVLKDDKVLTQLLDLFWTWDGTLSRLVARDLFTAELGNADAQQKHQFCSPFLVNAILTVSSVRCKSKGKPFVFLLAPVCWTLTLLLATRAEEAQ